MILDQWQDFPKLDPQNMLAEIDGLPDQLQAAWELGGRLELPAWEGIRRVVVAGMGGSAIGGDLLQAYAAPLARVPIIIWRNYGLPAFAAGEGTLVLVSSHSGNTEETLTAYQAAREAGARVLALTTGGELAQRARRDGASLWIFEHTGQPRAAVGYSFGLLLAALNRLELLPDPSAEMKDALAAMREQQEALLARVPVVQNPAKRMAGQLMGRWPVILGADHLEPVARRWRTQISELAKALGQFEALPEADHNMVAGVLQPEALFPHSMLLFLDGAKCHLRNRLRVEITRQILMLEGFNTDVIRAAGESRLAEQWTALHFGDYTAYYLAIAYGIDPTPVQAIEGLKAQLKAAQWEA
jgi:glucose/mannose-6-phosphate isomerase